MTAFILGAAAVTSTIGVLGGLGGAMLLVPALVLAGMPVSEAAPLGLLTAAAGSVAAGPRHLTERLVNHRLGLTIELAATTGAVGGALVSGLVPERPLVLVLAGVALAAALVGGGRKVVRNPAQPDLGPEHVGERVGALGGAYMTRFGVAPYNVKRVPAGLALVTLSGVVAGIAGASGGFIKTPVLSELMNIPTRVAAATTTFTIGITSSAALVIFALQGRLDTRTGAAAVLGGLLGALTGARLQAHLSAIKVRRALSVVLVVVAVVLVVSS
ncbi:MAG TPA: sulfite exporter TauE/SafE family protein [Acidimicrobiia bacterium]|nr:sulfite exporter TauE/SafE family protein [Acidimicrobiia bacterium]